MVVGFFELFHYNYGVRLLVGTHHTTRGLIFGKVSAWSCTSSYIEPLKCTFPVCYKSSSLSLVSIRLYFCRINWLIPGLRRKTFRESRVIRFVSAVHNLHTATTVILAVVLVLVVVGAAAKQGVHDFLFANQRIVLCFYSKVTSSMRKEHWPSKGPPSYKVNGLLFFFFSFFIWGVNFSGSLISPKWM